MVELSRRNIWTSSALIAVFSVGAKVAGLVRDRVLAGHFGASHDLDVYYSAFRVPDLVFNLFVLGALSSAFIPVFIERFRSDEKSAWRLAQNFFNLIFGLVAVSGIAAFIFTRPLSFVIAPGFSEASRELLVRLLRIMMISPVLFTLSTFMGSLLQSFERFVAYSLAPIFYNLGIIFGALILVPRFANSGDAAVIGLGWGVVLGAFLHLMIQLPWALRIGFRFSRVFDVADAGLRRIVRLMVPRTIGLGAYSVESLVMNAVASVLGSGSITVFNFANNLQFVPISVLGVSVATAVLPRLSSQAGSEDLHHFRVTLNAALGRTLVIVVPLATLMYVFRQPIIDLVYKTGAFASADVSATAAILGIFMLGVPAQSLVPIMSRAFFALQNTRTPVMVSIAAIAANLVLGTFFTFTLGFGIKGLALSFSVAGNLNFILLYLLFRKKYLS